MSPASPRLTRRALARVAWATALTASVAESSWSFMASAAWARGGDDDEDGGRGRGRGRGGDDNNSGHGSSDNGGGHDDDGHGGDHGGGHDGSGPGGGAGPGGSGSPGYNQPASATSSRGAARVAGDVTVRYADGWTERIVAGRYELLDNLDRLVVSRPATAEDYARLIALR